MESNISSIFDISSSLKNLGNLKILTSLKPYPAENKISNGKVATKSIQNHPLFMNQFTIYEKYLIEISLISLIISNDSLSLYS